MNLLNDAKTCLNLDGYKQDHEGEPPHTPTPHRHPGDLPVYEDLHDDEDNVDQVSYICN